MVSPKYLEDMFYCIYEHELTMWRFGRLGVQRTNRQFDGTWNCKFSMKDGLKWELVEQNIINIGNANFTIGC